MRAGVPGVATPHPVLETLPALYRPAAGTGADPFLARFCGALDSVLAPVVGTLDSFPAYLDVATAPSDFLPWLARWVGLPPSPGRADGAARQVLRAANLHQGWQGTALGIAQVVESVSGLPVTVEDTGGVSWSADPEAPAAESAAPEVTVRVRVAAGETVDHRGLEALVASLTPVHVSFRVLLVTDG